MSTQFLVVMGGIGVAGLICAALQLAYAHANVRVGRTCYSCHYFDVISHDDGDVEYLCGAGLGYEPIPSIRTCTLHDPTPERNTRLS